MDSLIRRRHVGPVGMAELCEGPAAEIRHDGSAYPIAVAMSAHKVHFQPVPCADSLVAEKQRGSVIVDDQHIHAAVIVIVADCQSSTHNRALEHRTRLRADIAKVLPVLVSKQQGWL